MDIHKLPTGFVKDRSERVIGDDWLIKTNWGWTRANKTGFVGVLSQTLSSAFEAARPVILPDGYLFAGPRDFVDKSYLVYHPSFGWCPAKLSVGATVESYSNTDFVFAKPKTKDKLKTLLAVAQYNSSYYPKSDPDWYKVLILCQHEDWYMVQYDGKYGCYPDGENHENYPFVAHKERLRFFNENDNS